VAAPVIFGPLSNTLLVGPNLNHPAPISGFNLATGQFVGTIKDTNGKDIAIDQTLGDWVRAGGNANSGRTKPTLLRLRSL